MAQTVTNNGNGLEQIRTPLEATELDTEPEGPSQTSPRRNPEISNNDQPSSISRPRSIPSVIVLGRIPTPLYLVWEITEDWVPLQVPIFHDILDYLYHDRYLEPNIHDASAEAQECGPQSHDNSALNDEHFAGMNPSNTGSKSARPQSQDNSALNDEHVLETKTSNAVSKSAPEPGVGAFSTEMHDVSNLSAETTPAVLYHQHKGPLFRPRLCILVRPYDSFVLSPDLERQEINQMLQHWQLPAEIEEIMAFPDLNPGFIWNRIRCTGGGRYFHAIFCYSRTSTLVTSYSIRTKETRGFWLTPDPLSTRPVLHKIQSETFDLQHPLCVQRHLLDHMVTEMAYLSHTFLETLTSSINSLNNAFSTSNSQQGGFEEHFLKASRLYLYARRSVFAKLNEADSLVQLMRESLAQLEAEPTFWSWSSGTTSLSDIHYFLRDRLDLSDRRLGGFRRAIRWRDEQLQKNFGILHDLINMRDGRVSRFIAKTSEQIARESKRDSSAMKTLAVLTTVFLPPTFVATLFSTPLFNFPAPTSSILSSRFWIYWAVSIPLTVFVILVWMVWYRWSVNRHRIEDEQQKGKDAIFGSFEAHAEETDLEFEFKRNRTRKAGTIPILPFLGRVRHRDSKSESGFEESLHGSSKWSGFWQRLLKRVRGQNAGSSGSGEISLVDD